MKIENITPLFIMAIMLYFVAVNLIESNNFYENTSIYYYIHR